MTREERLQSVADQLTSRGLGCQVQPFRGEPNLRCSRLTNGRYHGPCFWLFISDQDEWRILTMQDECFAIPADELPADVAEATLNEMDSSMAMPADLIEWYRLAVRKIN
ncbi:hypothetical protein [Tuwongella immobilis]|uniref:Uncharacterized protein n=1 Tax=Tuwongella immobilis TaxID=692036 RepID=A0A6C2YM16_9BACT|nr:hypothetical protein [Tuwongella immobilis]VIP02125.1 unnamed protein product [Tuwongella immobilis]VTS00461.1 unnamed protein product [Tuwongella immobilis]